MQIETRTTVTEYVLRLSPEELETVINALKYVFYDDLEKFGYLTDLGESCQKLKTQITQCFSPQME